MAKGGGFQRRNVTPTGKPTFTYSRQTSNKQPDEWLGGALLKAGLAGEAACHTFVELIDHLGLLELAMTLPEWSAHFEIKVEDMPPEVAEQIKRGMVGEAE